MKETRSLINSLLVCGVITAMALTLPAQTTKEDVARVIRVQGAARIQAPGGAWQDIRVGSVIKPGSVVQSGIEGSSYIDIAVGGKGPMPTLGAAEYRKPGPTATYNAKTKRSVVHMYANTSLGFDKMTVTETGAETVSDAELDLRAGHILGNVKKPTAGSEFRVRYPKGIAAIRGGIFDMTVERVKYINPNTKVAGEQVHTTVAVASGAPASVTAVAPDGTPTSVDVPPVTTWDSGAVNPVTGEVAASASNPTPPGVVNQQNGTGAAITVGQGAAPVTAVSVSIPSSVLIQIAQPSVTPTSGGTTGGDAGVGGN